MLGASGGLPARPRALVDGGTVAMGKVAAVNMTLTGTPGGPVGQAGQLLVTGGAVAGDGTRLALRTYTDAYVWPLAGSDVPAALAAAPVRIAAAGVAAGRGDQLHVRTTGTSWSPARGCRATSPSSRSPAGDRGRGGRAAGGPVPSLTDLTSSGLSPITSALIAAAVATVVVWIGGMLRRRRPDRRP